MYTKTYLFKVLSVLVVFAMLINTSVYAMPTDRSALRAPSAAVATVNAENMETKTSSAGRITLAIVLAGVLALYNASSATAANANYDNSIKSQVEAQQTAAKRSVEELRRSSL